ncbi:hypothetical protein LJK88_07625 [Paenibacillus sp. P26]|nr:hypothetical protein LJK88_07625 [Paenibacillus sp. P26]
MIVDCVMLADTPGTFVTRRVPVIDVEIGGFRATAITAFSAPLIPAKDISARIV